jgi:predicted kinase
MDLLNEGVNDPGIFKAVFLAGGPGSGKSYVAGQLFGIPDNINVSVTGLKMVNQDQELETMLNKFYGPKSGADSTVDYLNIQAYPPELFKQLTDPTFDDYAGLRGSAKYLSKKRMKNYLKGRLGVIIDGTGHKYSEIKKDRQELIDLGYDTYMIFVTTSLEIAQERNESRPRQLPVDTVEKYWKEVQKNMAVFQGLFGSANFLLVDNNQHLSSKAAQKKFNMLVKKGISKFLKKPLKSKIAKKWIAQQKLVGKK